MPDEIISILTTGGLGAVGILTAMLVANFAGRWYSKGAVDKLEASYKLIIEEQGSRIDALQVDRNFYRDLVLRMNTNQEKIAESQEKIVQVVERAVTQSDESK